MTNGDAALRRCGRSHRGGVDAVVAAPVRPPEGSPNVVLVLLDDMGFSDVGPYGSEIPTPTLDRLAADGIRFTNYHTAPLCSPARAAIQTGMNPHRAGFAGVANFDPGFPGWTMEIDPSVETLPEALRAAGYATYRGRQVAPDPRQRHARRRAARLVAPPARVRALLRRAGGLDEPPPAPLPGPGQLAGGRRRVPRGLLLHRRHHRPGDQVPQGAAGPRRDAPVLPLPRPRRGPRAAARQGRPTSPATAAATTSAGTRCGRRASPASWRWGSSRPGPRCRPGTTRPATRCRPGRSTPTRSGPSSPGTWRCTRRWSTTSTRTSPGCSTPSRRWATSTTPW